MKALTVRDIPPEVARQLAERARARGASASRTIVKILEEYFRGGRDEQRNDLLHHDLDDLAGSWSAEQAAAFDASLREQRTIESDVWK